MKEYLALLAQREGRVVLGNKWANLWLLVIVLVVTFVCIGFSNSSILYLEEKMNDPFTNWVNIQNTHGAGKFDELRSALGDHKLASHYGYKDIQSDHYFALNILGNSDEKGNRPARYLECRFFEQLNSELMGAILVENNVIKGACVPISELDNKSLGFIITLDNLLKLGYSEDNLPAYIDYMAYSNNADTLGFKLYFEKYAAAPMPILAVVRRLPQNMDMIASSFWYSQYLNDDTYPFDFNNEDYQKSLFYFVSEEIVDFKERVLKLMPDSLRKGDVLPTQQLQHLQSWNKGSFMAVFPDIFNNSIDPKIYEDLAVAIENEFHQQTVIRLFAYECSDYKLPESAYLSVNFATLDSIRAFEHFVKDNYNIQIEMSQVNSKENFNAVRIMASILSWAMIVFSIVCIILFIVNMLQSYFQKVKRNMGTFKAFGISTSELINTYILILLTIIALSIISSLFATTIIQYGLNFAGLLKEGKYPYLSLWSSATAWIAIAIIIVSTVFTVYIVMKQLLKQTPGDLIYDR